MTVEGASAPFFTWLAERVGTAPLDEEEVTLVLRLAKVVADWSERRHAPLAAYAVGLAIGADAPERIARLREVLAAVEALAGAGEPGPASNPGGAVPGHARHPEQEPNG